MEQEHLVYSSAESVDSRLRTTLTTCPSAFPPTESTGTSGPAEVQVVRQDQEKADLEVIRPSEGVCAGHAPHLSEPQDILQGKWLSLRPFFFQLRNFPFHHL